MNLIHKKILDQFKLDASPLSCEPYGHGHINQTFLVVVESGRRYILQKISNKAFPDVAKLQHNIASITAYLQRHNDNPYGALTLIETIDNQKWYHHDDASDWRVYDFIENSICLQAPETTDDFYQAAVGFGQFQEALKDFPADTLYETIEKFHHTPNRYEKLRCAIETDVMDRAKDVQDEIGFALNLEEVAGKLVGMLERGILPLRVTHNDTKLNNVMLDKVTRKALCVIDLDTTMPGLSAYDFGDSIRFGAATAAEDERDLSKMTLDLELFRTFTRGYLKACPGLTEKEREVLPLGALTMTLECGVRFLTDYLEGDQYFAIKYEDHNLLRCRTQFKLVKEMMIHFEDMSKIIDEETRY